MERKDVEVDMVDIFVTEEKTKLREVEYLVQEHKSVNSEARDSSHCLPGNKVHAFSIQPHCLSLCVC